VIPYETIRVHLERRHRIATPDADWNDRVAIHEREHHAAVYPHQPALPLVVNIPDPTPAQLP